MLQALQVRLGKWPSFTGMEHGALHARAVHMATGLVRELQIIGGALWVNHESGLYQFLHLLLDGVWLYIACNTLI